VAGLPLSMLGMKSRSLMLPLFFPRCSTTPSVLKMDPKGFYVYWTNQNQLNFDGTFVFSQHPKVRNVFNLDFPDSNHLAKTLTIVSGPDMVNLTYHNFFASKEKVTQNWADGILATAYNAARSNACRQVFLEKIYIRISLQTNKDGKIPVKNIYKMFPADKKRVESALASAHLPKGKVGNQKIPCFLFLNPSKFQSMPNSFFTLFFLTKCDMKI
uniref:Uncharacterized protein n=1 Tax=Xiphophorus couchianus TaxID=32473 RepID=A0A3B5LZ60_9TELE